MKTLLLVLALGTVIPTQTTADRLAGVWTAEFQGHTYVRLELKPTNDTIGGTISVGDIEVDAQGAVRHATDARNPTPILDAKFHDATLTFARMDGTDTDRFELHLLEAGTAELRFLLDDATIQELAADGIPVPKPVRLTRR